ncbi:hypothetical protein B0I33_105497 [Prauserella shujinwangii]|uniref:4-amino-4-deoxy-L-arabinose transferase-like glycosyltransferase n=1 Tax=Prauserella shujinwangii TaxID=1453103 RepID=A0A2T0LVN9_9PSEU|nr:DUF6541 family protein [Prauserella shujinwangii]PRX47913.1 hypothetical protein B0I33_105497 [Prauserella shujinwangii]
MNFAVVLAACWLPGLAAGAAVRLRGWTLAAVAPALTFGLVGLGVSVLGTLGIPWHLGTFTLWTLGAVVPLAGFALLAARFRRPAPAGAPADEPRSPRDHLLIGGGVAVGMAVGAVAFLRGIGGLGRINQDWDAPFHGNLVRWIAEHDVALSPAFNEIAARPDDESFFYPDAYHALLALVFDPAALPVPELLNLAALAVVLCFPLGIAAMAAAWRMPTLAVASAAAVSTWFTAFPFDPLWRGPLYPYVAGVALVPALLAVARLLVVPRGVSGVAGVALGLAGLVALHTSLAVVAGVFLLLLLGAVAFRLEPIDWRVSGPHLVAAVLACAVLAAPLVLPALAMGEEVADFTWPATETLASGFGQTLAFTPGSPLPQWWVGLPALVGIVLLVRHRRMLWLVAAYAVFGGLYTASAALDGNTLVDTLTSPFYNDHWRLGALLPLVGAVALGQFVASAGGWLGGWARRLRPTWPPAATATAGVLVTGLVLAVLGNGAYLGRNATQLAEYYGEGPTVTPGERAAFAWLGERVRPGEHVMNDRMDGGNWMYALEGIRPVEWKYNGPLPDTPQRLLTRRLDQLGEGPWDAELRAALDQLNVRYVLVGRGFVRDVERRLGLRQLRGNPHFTEVFRNRDAVIYEIERRDVAPVATAGGN